MLISWVFFRVCLCLVFLFVRERPPLWRGFLTTLEHRNTRTPRNNGIAEKPRNTEFDSVVLFSHYRNHKLFRYIWVNKLHWHFSFYMACNGKTNQQRQIRSSGLFRLFRCSRGVPGCSGVFRGVPGCSSVPVFRYSGIPECSGFRGFSACRYRSVKP